MTAETQRHSNDDRSREKTRQAVEDSVREMIEAGFSADEVKAEVEYTLEKAEYTENPR